MSGHRKGHGIHSPFVYDLVSKVFMNNIDPAIVFAVEQVRKKMISDKRIILVKDLGSRSGSLKMNLRKVSEIARYSPVPRKYGELLSKMAAEFGKPLIIELGTSLGISTMYMAASSADATVYTIEGCPEIAEIARQNFIEAELNNIRILEGSFDEVLQDFSIKDSKPGLVFIDGHHRKKPVIKYFNRMAELSDSKTVIIIDDINYSKEMAEAWDEIKLHRKVSVSIDIFRMGILFFREGINHNDYIIRY
ncbi:MAG: class I SAM-dependent methyltransferase [Bacteroidales bacterium]|jgi:predicted O-methyltransferase YrrM